MGVAELGPASRADPESASGFMFPGHSPEPGGTFEWLAPPPGVPPAPAAPAQHEHGGPKGAEPTRFGDWEHKGIAIDF